ncbi:MAG: adenylate/guanylate cyclase, partial [Spirochaetia bacterium]|nr:adenylate/guanylate cyclase [Spirochaetia bacterium]
HRILTGLIVVTGAGAPVSLLIPYRYGMIVGAALALVSVSFMYAAGWLTLVRGYKPARYYLIAWSTLLFGVAVYVLKTFAILPANFITNWSQQIGSGLEVLLLSIALASRINLLREQSERAQHDLIAKQKEMIAVEKSLADSFARFVPSQFLSFLDRQTISDVQLGDQVQREMTILFADIRSFSRLSEAMSPAENFDFLNSYLKRIGPVIRRNNGFIDKFIGDAIMALFPASPEDAVKAAVAMQEAVREYNHNRLKKNYDPVRIGIGIHTGTLILGTIGEHERLETTVISDAVNLASRIENLTKRCGAPILISESTLFRLSAPDAYSLRMLGRVRVKGKENPVSVFEVYQGQPDYVLELIASTRGQFEHGVSAYYAREYENALTCFEKVLEVNPSDTAAALYLRSIRRVLALDGKPIE